MVPVETEGCLRLFTSSEAVLVYFYDDVGLVVLELVPGSEGFTTFDCEGEAGAE